MKENRNTITMDKHGNIIMPTNTANVWMSEPELVGLFGVIAPTVRAGIRAVYKGGVLKNVTRSVICVWKTATGWTFTVLKWLSHSHSVSAHAVRRGCVMPC